MTLPVEFQFRIGDEIIISGLKSKKDWNGKCGIIIGKYSKNKKRWPIEVQINKKPQAYLKTNNINIHKRGSGWVIDTSSETQRLNLLMKGYIRDLEAFSKVTSRQKKIFHDDFTYHMNDNLVCKGLKEFDKQLNVLKQTIMNLCIENNERIPPFLIDRTQVETMNDEMTHFEVIVAIEIGNNQFWQRITELRLHETTKLVYYARIKSVKIIDKKEFDKTHLQESEDVLNIKKVLNQKLNNNNNDGDLKTDINIDTTNDNNNEVKTDNETVNGNNNTSNDINDDIKGDDINENAVNNDNNNGNIKHNNSNNNSNENEDKTEIESRINKKLNNIDDSVKVL